MLFYESMPYIVFSLTPIVLAVILAAVLAPTMWCNERTLSLAGRTVGRRTLASRALAILLIAVFFVGRVFREDAVFNQMGLDAEGALLPAADMIAATAARWLGFLTVALTILCPFFKKREVHDFAATVAPISVIFSCLYLRESLITITGNENPFFWRNLLFIIELTLIMTIGLCELCAAIRERGFHDLGKRALGVLGLLAIYVIPYMPSWAPGALLGYAGGDPEGFNVPHRLLLYFGLFTIFFFYLVYRKRSFDERNFTVIALALSAFLNYFSYSRWTLTSLPLHICNTVVMLMLIAYVFRVRAIFYFTYFVNVLGTFFAIIMPDTVGSLSEPDIVLFWYNHLYALILPILGVALAIFPKPNFKMMLKAIGVFTLYFVVIAFIDGWFNNAPFNTDGATVDYFFLYSDFYAKKFAFVEKIKIPYDFYIGEQLIRLFPLYQAIIFAVFTTAMFGLWGVYAALFRVSDDHKELTRKKKALQADYLRLLAELGDRPLSEPLNPEGKDMIKIEHFTKIYNGSTRKSADDINLEIHAGEVFGFIGHNGAGKSTTIKSLVGIQSITEGRIEVEGYDITRQPMEAKMHIGYVSDNHAVYEKLTGREYVNYVADLYRVSRADREARLDKYVKMFHLEEAIDREIKGYSHGMKQKIMVISALIHNPKVWVLDEPLTGLDPTSAYQIKQCMREHANEGNIVFFSSHIIEVVERICDRIAIISGGKICQHSTMDEIRASGKTLEEIYLQYIDGPEGAMLAAERAEQQRELAERAAKAAPTEANG